MPTVAHGAPPRRTQLERRTATRRALVTAATQCLVAKGFAATTTTEVARSAGVSQGALFKHFASKDELLVATAEHLHDELIALYLQRFGRLQRTSDLGVRLDRALRLLWQLFQSNDMAAALELEIAARTDPALRAALSPVLDRHAARIRSVAASLFPDDISHPGFHPSFDLILEAMHGMAASRSVSHSPAAERRLLDTLTHIAHTTMLPHKVPHADPNP